MFIFKQKRLEKNTKWGVFFWEWGRGGVVRKSQPPGNSIYAFTFLVFNTYPLWNLQSPSIPKAKLVSQCLHLGIPCLFNIQPPFTIMPSMEILIRAHSENVHRPLKRCLEKTPWVTSDELQNSPSKLSCICLWITSRILVHFSICKYPFAQLLEGWRQNGYKGPLSP